MALGRGAGLGLALSAGLTHDEFYGDIGGISKRDATEHETRFSRA
jgi:hypothetical protein